MKIYDFLTRAEPFFDCDVVFLAWKYIIYYIERNKMDAFQRFAEEFYNKKQLFLH